MNDVEALWADFTRPIVTADDYIASLRGRPMTIYFMGERVPEPVDHPVIKPSINAMADGKRTTTIALSSASPHWLLRLARIASTPVACSPKYQREISAP